MPLKLTYRITELSFRPEVVESVRRVFGAEISKAYGRGGGAGLEILKAGLCLLLWFWHLYVLVVKLFLA